MAGIDQKTFWDFAKIVLGKKTSEPSRRVRATYLRTDPDGTGWVQLAGSDGETPVNGNAFASARSGDEVEIALDDGVLSISGNATDPAVGGSMAAGIASRIVEPVGKAARLANDIANAADKVAKAINQHFFTDSNGIHVTEATQEEWEQSHTGPNVLINSIGQLFRNGLTNLLSLLPAQGQTDTFTGDGTTVAFTLSGTPSTVVSVSVAGVDCDDYTVSGTTITLDTAPEDGDSVVVTYRTSETAIVIWDGLGNNAANVLAVFGEIVRIGRSTDRFIEIDSNGIKFFTWTGSRNQQDAAISDKAIELGPSKLTGESTVVPVTHFYNVPEGTFPGLVGPTVLYADSGGDTTTPIYFWNGMAHFVNLKAEQKLYASGGQASLYGSTDSVYLDNSGTGGLWRLFCEQGGNPNVKWSDDGGTSWETVVPTIERGSVGQSTNVPAGGYVDVSVDFDHTYSAAPTVVVGLQSTSSAAAIGQISVAVTSVSATGFTARIFNAGSTDRRPGFTWIAMG